MPIATKKPSDRVSAYTVSKSVESPSESRSSYDSGVLNNGKVMTTSDAPERNNYYEYSNPKDAQDAYESLQAENEMRASMKKGGKVKKSKVSTHQKNHKHPAW